jgi:UDP-N-acetylglucosamine--N-acetylmuramyl-(pentapeptide) pyrophosphoryl-undecaprenol N-acetylglucosamine transferase
MKAVITCGGTGGHITPALAIADIIKENDPRGKILFVGGTHGMEGELVSRAGYDIHLLAVQGLARKLTPTNLKVLFQAGRAAKRAREILAAFSPDIVIGTGGYACYPTLRAAIGLGIPTAVHESNALAGLAIRKLQDGMDRIFINFPQTEEQIKKQNRHKVMHVGNPLREGFGGLSYENARKKLGLRDGEQMVLSFGGSLGAERINEAMLDLMGEYAPKHPEIRIVHACGTVKYGPIYEEFCRRGLDALPNVMLTPYIYDMPTQMAAADVVICRAGAMTISELALMKKACVMIPSPNVTDNHQYKNAKALADGGAAVLLEEKDMLSGRLTQEVSALLTDGVARHSMEEAIASFARTDANKLIYDELMRLMAQSKKQGGEPLPEIPTPDVMPE